MKSFFILLKKEIRELITPQLVLPLIIMVFAFSLIGNLMTKEKERIDQPQILYFIDEDKTESSSEIKNFLTDIGFILKEGNVPSNVSSIEQLIEDGGESGVSAYLIIPQGVEAGLNQYLPQEIKVYYNITGFSALSGVKSAKIDQALNQINQLFSRRLIEKDLAQNVNPNIIQNPIKKNDYVVLNEKLANISPIALEGVVRSQTFFIPIMLFMVIILASQMVATTVATEKENKTLETLLSTPVKRKTIVLAKLAGSGLVALIFAGVYMIGFSSYLKGFMGSANLQSNPVIAQALQQLGLNMGMIDYILLGLSLFLSILCALAIAIILGILADSVKGVQGVTAPLMVLVMVPYFLTLFFDIHSLSPITKYLIYAIPFSHPFLASHNLIADNYRAIIIGIIYQLVIFAIFVYLASRIFSSDKILTIRLNFGRKKPAK